MTDCANVAMRERLPELLHGTLDGVARAEVLAHVADCTACADELALLREARRVLSRAPAVDVARIVAALPAPAGAAPRLQVSRGSGVAASAASAAQTREPPALVPHPRWRRLAVAAGLLLAAGTSGVTLARLADDGDGRGGAARAAATAPVAADDEPRLLAVNVAGLTADELAGLLDGLDDLEALPSSDPRPLLPVESPLGADAGDGAD